MEKRKGLRGLFLLLNHGSKPGGHYSSLRDKNQSFGADLVKFTHATRVLQEVLQERDNLLNAQVNKMKRRWDLLLLLSRMS